MPFKIYSLGNRELLQSRANIPTGSSLFQFIRCLLTLNFLSRTQTAVKFGASFSAVHVQLNFLKRYRLLISVTCFASFLFPSSLTSVTQSSVVWLTFRVFAETSTQNFYCFNDQQRANLFILDVSFLKQWIDVFIPLVTSNKWRSNCFTIPELKVSCCWAHVSRQSVLELARKQLKLWKIAISLRNVKSYALFHVCCYTIWIISSVVWCLLAWCRNGQLSNCWQSHFHELHTSMHLIKLNVSCAFNCSPYMRALS